MHNQKVAFIAPTSGTRHDMIERRPLGIIFAIKVDHPTAAGTEQVLSHREPVLQA